MRRPNAVYAALGTTVFEEMSRLAATHDAVNLGQGFPDDRGAPDVLRAAAEALVDGWNQYPSMWGLPAYDAYAPLVRRAGGTPRFVTLRPPEWRWDPAELAAAF